MHIKCEGLLLTVDIEEEQAKAIQDKILSFYDEHGRDLPWRTTRDAYKVWVSEVMLQQTQVSRVTPKYEAWMESYPAVDDLAEASFKDVLKHWDGLGYNNRAKWLHRAAQQLIDEYDGDVPRGRDSLKDLPGIGPYTARAIQIFAYNKDIVTVDTNIRRVLISELDLNQGLDEDDLYDVAKTLLPEGKSREWHNALMDYGAMVATSAQTGIKPTTSQSEFDGSVRQVRGEILRRLQDDAVKREALVNEYPDRAQDAIEGLVSDGLIKVEDGELHLV